MPSRDCERIECRAGQIASSRADAAENAKDQGPGEITCRRWRPAAAAVVDKPHHRHRTCPPYRSATGRLPPRGHPAVDELQRHPDESIPVQTRPALSTEKTAMRLPAGELRNKHRGQNPAASKAPI